MCLIAATNAVKKRKRGRKIFAPSARPLSSLDPRVTLQASFMEHAKEGRRKEEVAT